MRNIFLIVLDSVRRDFFYRNISDDSVALREDFVHFRNCHSTYTATCVSHYSIFFGDYYNKTRNESFPAQLKKLGFKTRSFCNGAIIVGYPLKEIVEEDLKHIGPFRDEMIGGLGIEPEFDWGKEMFGSSLEDYHGAADDENRNVPQKWKHYLYANKEGKNFIFLHFFGAHYPYGINDYLENPINGERLATIGKELIRRIKDGELREGFVKDIYSKRINELINTHLKDLINILKENKMYDDSLIIVTSDHGEGLGDIGRDYSERFLNMYDTILGYYDSLRRITLLRRFTTFFPKMRKLCHKWDYETFYHNANHELQKEVPLLVKFPNNEFGGGKYDKRVTLFDIIHTIDDLIGNKLDIRKDYGSSLYSLLALGEEGREKYRIKRRIKLLRSLKPS